MRSSYGFHKFVQAIYVVFERAAIVTSHDADAVSASITRPACDASLLRAERAGEGPPSASRIFIEKNRLFCFARCWRPSIALFFARLTRTERVDPRTPREVENRIEKIFKIFFDEIVLTRFHHAEARAHATFIASKLSRAMRSQPGL